MATSGSPSATLILELHGHASTKLRGVNFGLQTESSKASFVKVNPSETEIAQNGTVFILGSAPQLFKSVADGNTLVVSLAQKGQGNARPLDGALARVALQLQPGITQGTSITLGTTGCQVLPETGNPIPITIEVGKLVAQ
ncbi:MAG: hypothetical protein FWG02_08640 [Holophagaceae bacterium]|nr:hypothetical protein [Holophagaceae bacterium]